MFKDSFVMLAILDFILVFQDAVDQIKEQNLTKRKELDHLKYRKQQHMKKLVNLQVWYTFLYHASHYQWNLISVVIIDYFFKCCARCTST